jgi:hypothetical protein
MSTEGPAARLLTDEQRHLLTAILNCLVPPRDGLGGAGDLGIAAAVEVLASQGAPIRRLFLEGLAAVEIANARPPMAPFAERDAEAQEAVLRAVEHDRPIFFASLVEYTYRGYYAHPAVHAAISYETGAVQPRGYTLAPFDPVSLTRQRERAPFWRRTGA